MVANISRKLPALVPINLSGYEPINRLPICLFCNLRQLLLLALTAV
jgi:hypothetical protein